MSTQMEDVDRIMAVMEIAFDPQFGEAWTRRQIDDALLVGNCYYGLIDTDGNYPDLERSVAGFFLSRHGVDEEELLLFAVSPQFRRRGLGRSMLEELAAEARGRGAGRLLLEMRRGNPAEGLYRSFGFTAIGERPNYYRRMDGQRIDAITFAYQLK